MDHCTRLGSADIDSMSTRAMLVLSPDPVAGIRLEHGSDFRAHRQWATAPVPAPQERPARLDDR
jgi:hypothetical protein